MNNVGLPPSNSAGRPTVLACGLWSDKCSALRVCYGSKNIQLLVVFAQIYICLWKCPGFSFKKEAFSRGASTLSCCHSFKTAC